jgi:hypothetical protein
VNRNYLANLKAADRLLTNFSFLISCVVASFATEKASKKIVEGKDVETVDLLNEKPAATLFPPQAKRGSTSEA